MFLAWVVGEILAFAAVVHAFGLGGTIMLALVSSVVGASMLRRLGTGAARNLGRAVAGGEAPGGALLDGMLNALGAVLLIVPGFLTSLIGCVLASPSAREWAIRRLDGRPDPAMPRPSRRANDVIDLSPDDWRPVNPH